VVQAARRTAARIVVKVADPPQCAGEGSCAWAPLHYCATEQARAWDLLDLRAADAGLRQPPGDVIARLGLDAAQLQSCLSSRPAGQAGARAAAAVRVMKREGGPWLDVEGFGWTGEPPHPGDVISVIDAVISAYRGGEQVQPRRLRPQWEGAPDPTVALADLRAPASAPGAHSRRWWPRVGGLRRQRWPGGAARRASACSPGAARNRPPAGRCAAPPPWGRPPSGRARATGWWPQLAGRAASSGARRRRRRCRSAAAPGA
jgi:hypothetical protein